MSPFVVLLILGVSYINGVISRTCKCTHFGEKTCDYDSDCKWYPDHTLCRSIQWFLCEMDDECRETRLPKTPDPYPDWPWDCPDFIPGSDPDEPTRTPSQQAIIDQDDDENQGKNSKHKNKKNKDKQNDMDDDDLLPSPYTTQVDDSTQDPETTCGGYGKLIGLECGCVSDGICEGESCEDGPTIECDTEGAVCCCGSDCPIDRGMKDKPPPGGGGGQPPPGQGGPPPKGGGGQPPPGQGGTPPQGGGGKGAPSQGGDKGGAPPQGGAKGGAPPPGGGKGGQGGPPQGGSGKGGGQGAPAPPPGGKKSGKSDKGGKGGKATSAPINLKKHDYYYGDNSQYEYNGYDNQYDNGYYPPQEPQEPQQPMPPQDNGYGYGYGYGNSYGYGNDYNEINDEDQDNDGNDEQQLPPPPPEAGLPSQDEPPPVGGLPPQDDDGNEPPPPPPGQGNEQPPPPTNGNEPPPPPPGQGDEPPQQPPPPPLPGTTQQEDEDDDDDDYDIGLAGDINIIEQEPNIGRSIKFGYAEIFIAFICMVLICCGIALCWNKKKYGTNMKKLIDIDDDNQYHYDYATFSNV